jgi:hypothetical protein
MAYATIEDIEVRTGKTYANTEKVQLAALLCDAGVLIDSFAPNAADDAKRVVSCRMVIRAFATDEDVAYPLGATQGSMTAGPYTQSWTVGVGGGAGELYLGKADKQLLGGGNQIGSYSPAQELAVNCLD